MCGIYHAIPSQTNQRNSNYIPNVACGMRELQRCLMEKNVARILVTGDSNARHLVDDMRHIHDENAKPLLDNCKLYRSSLSSAKTPGNTSGLSYYNVHV